MGNGTSRSFSQHSPHITEFGMVVRDWQGNCFLAQSEKMRFLVENAEKLKKEGLIGLEKNRKEQLHEISKNIDKDVLSLMNPLIDQLVFLEEKLDYLRTLPFILVNARDPARQKTTPAYKQYKDLSQTYINALKVINSALGIDGDKVESPLRDYMNERKKRLETR